ncbi:MAG: hypothetical protein IKH05_03320 [Bacteroidaceae bacterium]|nr:hypothetical protein [Bacteroidaceae bacterium]
MKEEKSIRQLLEMLDNPDAYTEQEIRDIINRNEDTREAYRLMVESKRSIRHSHANNLTNVDAAWKRFNRKRKAQKQRFNWMKFAASLIIVLLITGVSLAAYQKVTPKQKTTAEADSIYYTVAVNPSYPGGDEQLFKFIADHTRYPRPCEFFDIQGRIVVTFVVEKDGRITNIRKVRGPGIKLTQKQVNDYNAAYPDNKDNLKVGQNRDLLYIEAERVLKQMPKWKPAKNDRDKIVRSHYFIPFNFRLDKSSRQK